FPSACRQNHFHSNALPFTNYTRKLRLILSPHFKSSTILAKRRPHVRPNNPTTVHSPHFSYHPLQTRRRLYHRWPAHAHLRTCRHRRSPWLHHASPGPVH